MPLIPKCEKCNTEMILKEKGEDKFWGCQKWKECGGRTRPYEGVDKKRKDGFELIGEALFNIESKLDILLGDKLPKVEEAKNEMSTVQEDEIDVKNIPF